ANFGRFGPCRPLVNRCQRQQPASLRPILALPCQNAKLTRIEVAAQRDWSRHDEPPRFAMLNLTRKPLGIAYESQFQGLGIRPRPLRSLSSSIRAATQSNLVWLPASTDPAAT